MDLSGLIADPDCGIADIGVFLDGLDSARRWEQLARLDRGQQRILYRKAADTPLDLMHLAGDAAARVEVVHDGLNTLPVPPRLRRFQKRFCRPGEPDGQRLFGYNEGPTRRLLGPGYFVARPTETRQDWAALGGVVVDYFQVPDTGVAAGWPPVVPNNKGLQRFVYHETRDFMRRVSAHVCVGAAYKRDRPLDHYFVLCRR